MGGEICFVLVYYDHEIVLEGLKQSIVVCAIVLFICGGGGGKKGDLGTIIFMFCIRPHPIVVFGLYVI